MWTGELLTVSQESRQKKKKSQRPGTAPEENKSPNPVLLTPSFPIQVFPNYDGSAVTIELVALHRTHPNFRFSQTQVLERRDR
jgi:hypothetical protein